ncbi:hypothetical protein HY413_02885 [Candidatus Kaiserbacteria bacterium]|nr:hypothetical protein [Candidatus Kaiserbacteria bacterium]
MAKPKLIIFASGTKDGGGSGFEKLVTASRSTVLDADIVAVISNHEHGGVRQRAERLGIPFRYFKLEGGSLAQAAGYQRIVRETGAEWVILSGWLKLVLGLDPRRTCNIHPALLSALAGRFGGKGMYGHRVHEAVKTAHDDGEIGESGFSMHFVTNEYDRGPVFAEIHAPLHRGMTADEIGRVVNALEHAWQPWLTNLVVHGEISWDGKNPESLRIPKNLYKTITVI